MLEHAKKYRSNPLDWMLEENPAGNLVSLEDPIVIEVIRKAAALDKLQLLSENNPGLHIYESRRHGVALNVQHSTSSGTTCQKDNLLLAVEGYTGA